MCPRVSWKDLSRQGKQMVSFTGYGPSSIVYGSTISRSYEHFCVGRSLVNDIKFKISDNMLRGAAETYFSGKILAKVARTTIIASELKLLAEESPLLSDIYKEDK